MAFLQISAFYISGAVRKVKLRNGDFLEDESFAILLRRLVLIAAVTHDQYRK